MIDPGLFFVGLAVGAGALFGIAYGWSCDEKALDKAAIQRAETKTVRQRLELAKLNRAIRRRNRKIANLRRGGASKPARTPVSDAAGPRAAPSPKVGKVDRGPLLLP